MVFVHSRRRESRGKNKEEKNKIKIQAEPHLFGSQAENFEPLFVYVSYDTENFPYIFFFFILDDSQVSTTFHPQLRMFAHKLLPPKVIQSDLVIIKRSC